jgi:hypothetical protein
MSNFSSYVLEARSQAIDLADVLVAEVCSAVFRRSSQHVILPFCDHRNPEAYELEETPPPQPSFSVAKPHEPLQRAIFLFVLWRPIGSLTIVFYYKNGRRCEIPFDTRYGELLSFRQSASFIFSIMTMFQHLEPAATALRNHST